MSTSATHPRFFPPPKWNANRFISSPVKWPNIYSNIFTKLCSWKRIAREDVTSWPKSVLHHCGDDNFNKPRRASFNLLGSPPTHRCFQPRMVDDQLAPICCLGDRCEAAFGDTDLIATLQILVDQLLTSRFTNCFGWHGFAWLTTFNSLTFWSHTQKTYDSVGWWWWWNM